MSNNKDAWQSLIKSLINEGILRSSQVIRAMQLVSRESFLPENMSQYASADCPLSIGMGQTVSAPHMVAIMNEALELAVGQRVLEVGAGSGWHAATVAEVVAPNDKSKEEWGHVYTVEIIASLAEYARNNLSKAGFGNRVTIIHRDGSLGYAEQAPYDRVLVTAAAPNLPPPLIEQLKDNGVMVIPIGNTFMFQSLIRVRKGKGQIKEENLGGVAFVPLTGKHGHKPI